MFGWLRKRERREQIKLLKQNHLAASYLEEVQENFIEAGLSENDDLASTLALVGFAASNYLSDLQTYRIMPPERFNEQFKANKDLRRLYDEVLSGRKAFAQQFGNATERLESFDAKFQPNEGWRIFLDRFPQSTEQLFRGE